MIQIEFGKDRYHTNDVMINWCRNNISGFGGWVFADPDDWDQGRKWAVSSQFGNTTFYFDDDRDATLFSLRWT
jgi:hypothetical protein